jgi:type II secretory pathway component PulF
VTFNYIAIDRAGEEVKGSIESDDKDKVINHLRQSLGLFPVQVENANAVATKLKWWQKLMK